MRAQHAVADGEDGRSLDHNTGPMKSLPPLRDSWQVAKVPGARAALMAASLVGSAPKAMPEGAGMKWSVVAVAALLDPEARGRGGAEHEGHRVVSGVDHPELPLAPGVEGQVAGRVDLGRGEQHRHRPRAGGVRRAGPAGRGRPLAAVGAAWQVSPGSQARALVQPHPAGAHQTPGALPFAAAAAEDGGAQEERRRRPQAASEEVALASSRNVWPAPWLGKVDPESPRSRARVVVEPTRCLGQLSTLIIVAPPRASPSGRARRGRGCGSGTSRGPGDRRSGPPAPRC